MRHVLVVYESMFGNTKTIAEAVADGLSAYAAVELVEVGAAPATLPVGVDALVVGGPTHAFGMSRASTREDAARQAQGTVVSSGIGIREWLESLAPGDVTAAAFDTRIKWPRVPGSAAHGAERHLRHRGFRILAKAETFWVQGSPGPLYGGEADRARRWGEKLGRKIGSQQPVG